ISKISEMWRVRSSTRYTNTASATSVRVRGRTLDEANGGHDTIVRFSRSAQEPVRSHMAKRALITGITGQDGSYLADLLLDKGYDVVGMIRRSSSSNLWRIEHLLDRLTLKPADLLDQLSIIRLLDEVRPHEMYNLAAMSFVPASWDQPMLTGEYNSQGVT